MRRILTGQTLLVLCCVFYLIWWYRGYRPGAVSGRVSGINGILLLITRYGFHRIVTTELILIVGWTVLEMTVINRLSAAGGLSDRGFAVMCIVIAAAFLISMVLYVAYYRMEEMKAFYAAMVPLVTEASAMVVLIGIMLAGSMRKL